MVLLISLKDMSYQAALALKLKLLKRRMGVHTQMMLWYLSETERNAVNLISDGGGNICPYFSHDCAMVLLISPEQIELEGCACAEIEALEEENRWLYPDDAGELSMRGNNATNLISNSGDLFCPFFSNWCHGFANISRTNRARKLHLRSN